MVKPRRKPKVGEVQEEIDEAEELRKVTPTASRHLFLIRHGQYDEEQPDDYTQILTKLGKM